MAEQTAARDDSPRGEAPKARALNEEIRYIMYAVFRARPVGHGGLPEADRGAAAQEADELLDQARRKDVVTRGTYDLSGYRGDADLMVWLSAPDPDLLQETYGRLRRTRLGQALEPVWSVVGLHRPAEFNRSHVPAYLKREDPRRYVCVYPFVRSLEWYLLPDYERRGMLAEHGYMGREYEDVRANTVACFGLNDYEWLLAFEADEVHRIVDCLRHLRASKARVHTRVETPFYTGLRKPLADIVASLP